MSILQPQAVCRTALVVHILPHLRERVSNIYCKCQLFPERQHVPPNARHGMWGPLNHVEDQASTAIASFYAPVVGIPEPERVACWQR